jgi:hypothetical protein
MDDTWLVGLEPCPVASTSSISSSLLVEGKRKARGVMERRGHATVGGALTVAAELPTLVEGSRREGGAATMDSLALAEGKRK